jgi:hypothetical protein
MVYLKVSTAKTLRVGPFLDSVDGVTIEPGLAIAQADILLSKSGGAFAASHDAGGATYDSYGFYYLQLDTTDTDTAGPLVVSIQEAGACPVWQEFTVLTANAYNALFSTGNFEVDVVKWLGTACAPVTAAGVPKVDMTHINGSLTNDNLATLKLKSLNVINDAGSAIYAVSTGGDGTGIRAEGSGDGNGMTLVGGAQGSGLEASTAGTGHGIHAVSSNTGSGIRAEGGDTSGDGITATTDGAGSGIHAHSTDAGSGIYAQGGITSGDGIYTTATDGHGINAYAGGANHHGIYASADIFGGGSGNGIAAYGAAGAGITAVGDGAGNGITATGGATAGNGMELTKGAGGKDIDADEIDDILTDTGTDIPLSISALPTDASITTACETAITNSEPIDANITQINGSLTNDNLATLKLKALSIINDGGDAILAKSTGGDGKGISAIGFGIGPGINSTGGDSADGIRADGGINGNGIKATGNIGIDANGAFGGTFGIGIRALGGGTSGIGNGMLIISSDDMGDSSDGLSIIGSNNGTVIQGGGDGNGLSAYAGGGSGSGIHARGGVNAGTGIYGDGGIDGVGAKFLGDSTGAGIQAQGGITAGAGAEFLGGTDGVGISAVGDGIGDGIKAQGGTTGHGMELIGGGDGSGIYAKGAGIGAGISAEGGLSGGDGVLAFGTDTGNGLRAISGVGATGDGLVATARSTDGRGMFVNGVGSGEGIKATGGADGDGGRFAGGANGKDGLVCQGTGGSIGSGGDGLVCAGGTRGSGILAQGGSVFGNGIVATSPNEGHGIVGIAYGDGAGMNLVGKDGAQHRGDGLTLTSDGATAKDINASQIDAIKVDTEAILVAIAASALTVDEISDAVWDELLAAHVIVGSSGAALSASGATGASIITDIKNLLYKKTVSARHDNDKPKTIAVGAGATAITVTTTQDSDGNTATETYA